MDVLKEHSDFLKENYEASSTFGSFCDCLGGLLKENFPEDFDSLDNFELEGFVERALRASLDKQTRENVFWVQNRIQHDKSIQN